MSDLPTGITPKKLKDVCEGADMLITFVKIISAVNITVVKVYKD